MKGERVLSFYKRKSPRIANYDYGTQNYYFITICTHDRKCIFGSAAELNHFGIIAKRNIETMCRHYDNVSVDKFTVMPNHVHFILVLGKSSEITATQIVGQYKAGVTRQIRKIVPDALVWQRSFHDHIIRNQMQYEKIWYYIENNPLRWQEDCFFSE